MRILLVDNDDSFTRNLEHLLAQEAEITPDVLPYADFRPELALDATLLVISPGPGHPREYSGYLPLFDPAQPELWRVPLLGVCLGMQIVNHAFGGEIAPLPGCVHGKTETIDFLGQAVRVARYHSLHVATPGTGVEVLAANAAGVPMAVRHQARACLGYQFHPESFLTASGGQFIRHAFATLV